MQTKSFKIKDIVPEGVAAQDVNALVEQFIHNFLPLEGNDVFHVFVDARTNARFCECHIPADKLVALSTTDVPLDPDEQGDYRANREIVTSHVAFQHMREDAKKRRAFSNIVAEFTTEYDAEHPLKIIGGQHRYQAIKEALEGGVGEYHGIKVYFGLDSDQRLDVQVISNTVIAVSPDLYDRMQETVKGPELREWCQKVGLLPPDTDFADKRQRGAPITVRIARSFVMNYYVGVNAAEKSFDKTDTTPIFAQSGVTDELWDKTRGRKPSIWKDLKLHAAGEEFAALVNAQRAAFSGKKGNADSQEKAFNYAVLAAWAYVAGVLSQNEKRLQRHFSLKSTTGKDPLNASALAKGRHKTDPENYRGLGYRTDSKERGRFVELFYAQAEKGEGINVKLIEVAIARFHAKQANLEVSKVEQGATS